jgi:hypothetical protein
LLKKVVLVFAQGPISASFFSAEEAGSFTFIIKPHSPINFLIYTQLTWAIPHVESTMCAFTTGRMGGALQPA